jgi:hypothetical protein
MRTVYQTGAVSLQSTATRVTKSNIAPGHSGSSILSSILTFPIDSATLGIRVQLVLSNSFSRSIQHPALLLNPTGMLRFTAYSSACNMHWGLK